MGEGLETGGEKKFLPSFQLWDAHVSLLLSVYVAA